MPPPATPSPAHPHQSRSSALSQVVPQWVAQQFYRHGLFCSSQPLAVLVFAFVGIVWACYPLLTIPVYSGDAKIWVQSDTEDTLVRGDWLLLFPYYDPMVPFI